MELRASARRVGVVLSGLGAALAVCAALSAVAFAGSLPKEGRTPAPPIGNDGARAILWTDGVKNAYPRWSRDGARILYESDRSGRWQLYVMNQDGSGDHRITDETANDELPDWSPDNTRIAFVSDRTGNQDVFVMSADGGDVRNLSRSPARDIHPYWSPDSKWILFNSNRAGARLQLYQVRPDGTGLHRLAVSGDEETCARVSPAGDRIVLLANLAAGRDDLILRLRDGSNPINLTNDPARDGWPTWTPDGKRLVFASARDGRFALYTMRPNGTDLRRITRPPSPAVDGRPSVSPDGRQILFNRQVGETIGIFVIDLPGEETPTSEGHGSIDIGHALDWTIGVWHGTRSDAADGSSAPMTMTVEPILGGHGQLRRVEIGEGENLYRGIAVQIPDRDRKVWIRQYTNGLHGSFAALVGKVTGATSVWSSAGRKTLRRSSVVSEHLTGDRWRRTMSVSEDGGSTWRVLWIDDLERLAAVPEAVTSAVGNGR